VPCTPSTPAPARKRRRPRQDLQDRLARCEALLKQYVAADASETTNLASKTEPELEEDFSKSPSPPSPLMETPSSTSQTRTSLVDDYTSNDPATAKKLPPGKLYRNDGTVRFVDSVLVGTISDELQAMRDILEESPARDAPTPSDEATPEEHSDLLLGGGDSPGVPLDDLHPDPGQIFRLWQIFLERINPLLKVIHVPSMQPILGDAIGGVIPKDIEPLIFAIYTITVACLTREECFSILGMSRDEAHQRYAEGVRRSLVRIGFMKKPSVTILQAMLFYLVSKDVLARMANALTRLDVPGKLSRPANRLDFARCPDAIGSENRRSSRWRKARIITIRHRNSSTHLVADCSRRLDECDALGNE
jgi:hypothetical protein